MSDDIRNQRQPMAREDKIALLVLGLIIAGVSLALMLGLQSVLGYFIDMNERWSEGIGLRTSFIVSLFISFFFVIVFALVAGEGVIGELGVMFVSFFSVLIFFTVSIAVIF
jgi:hypothetical protein